VILYDNRIVVFKVEGDVMLYVVGGADENEILLYSALLALRDSLSILLKYVVSAQAKGFLLPSLHTTTFPPLTPSHRFPSLPCPYTSLIHPLI